MLGEGVVLALRDLEIDRREGSRGPGSSKAAAEAGPGRLTRTSSSGADMLWAPKAPDRGLHGPEDTGRAGCGCRRPDAVPAGHAKEGWRGRTHGPWRALAGNGYPVGVSGYAAMAQIGEAHPAERATLSPRQFVRLGSGGDRSPRRAKTLVGRSFDDRLAEWWDSVTANLSQTTFFLLDPESWR